MYIRLRLVKLFTVLTFSLGVIGFTTNSHVHASYIGFDYNVINGDYLHTNNNWADYGRSNEVLYSILFLHKTKLKIDPSRKYIMTKEVKLKGGRGDSLSKVSNISTTSEELYIDDDIILSKEEVNGLRKVVAHFLQQSKQVEGALAGRLLSKGWKKDDCKIQVRMEVIHVGELSSFYPNFSSRTHLFQLEYQRVRNKKHGKASSSKFFYFAITPQATLYHMQWEKYYHKGTTRIFSFSNIEKFEITGCYIFCLLFNQYGDTVKNSTVTMSLLGQKKATKKKLLLHFYFSTLTEKMKKCDVSHEYIYCTLFKKSSNKKYHETKSRIFTCLQEFYNKSNSRSTSFHKNNYGAADILTIPGHKNLQDLEAIFYTEYRTKVLVHGYMRGFDFFYRPFTEIVLLFM